MPLVVRPRRLLVVCRVAGVVLLVVFGVLAVLLRRGTAGGEQFGIGDQIAFFAIGVLLAWAVLQFTRARVVADERGLQIRNYVGEKVIPWQVVAAVRLDDGSPWASLDLQDDDTVALLAVQANDGIYAVETVLELRRLLAISRGSSGG
jgi:Bacterial PH domain